MRSALNPQTAPELITLAAACLRNGGVVAFPTETVYGLGADARNEAAVRRVFEIKGRPVDHPLIVHLASAEWLDEWAREVPEMARRLADVFWPGPLTLVLPRQPWVSDKVTGGQDSVALRVPAHPVAQELIAASGALVAPSANRFGRVSPTTAGHVRDEFGEDLDLILDGGPCPVGVESTIVSLLGDEPRLLRPGAVSLSELEAVLGRQVVREAGGMRAPGALPAHYAPATPLEVLAGGDLWRRAAELSARGLEVAVLSLGRDGAGTASHPGVHQEAMPTCPADYARLLYAALRSLDSAGFHILLAELPPDTPEWLAVRDRLARAAKAFARCTP